MHDTPTTLLVAERDEKIRAFLLDNLAADGYEPLGAQTEEETRLKLRNHGPALLGQALAAIRMQLRRGVAEPRAPADQAGRAHG
jgi:DNA-binding response OmpR family regulator